MAQDGARIQPMDAPPGLCCHSGFLTQLERAGAEGGCGLALLDLDRFGAFNRCFGPAAAEAVLQRVAAQLSAFVAPMAGTLAARLGGDEFVVLWPAPQTPTILAQNVKALHVAMRARPTDTLIVTLSVGAAIGAARDAGGLTLLSRADLALYKAKARGRDRFVLDGEADGLGSTISPVAAPGHRC